jgi:hypothetical protein
MEEVSRDKGRETDCSTCSIALGSEGILLSVSSFEESEDDETPSVAFPEPQKYEGDRRG